MGFFKNLFKKKNEYNKYNIKAKRNQPRKVYGVPNPNKYDIKPKENQPREVYGIPNPNKHD